GPAGGGGGPPDGPDGPPGGGGGGGGDMGGGVPSSAAFTASIGSRSGRAGPAPTTGRTVVSRSSGGTAARRAPPPAADPLWMSLAGRSSRSPLFTGRARAVARRPGTTRSRALGGPHRAEHI